MTEDDCELPFFLALPPKLWDDKHGLPCLVFMRRWSSNRALHMLGMHARQAHTRD